MTKILPRAKQVLVRPDDEESKVNSAGIITPDDVEEEEKAIGTVEAIGAGIDDVKVGDRVIFGAFAGEQITLKDDDEKEIKYRILFDEDVLALIED